MQDGSTNNGNCININIGQTGLRIGEKLLRQFSADHNISSIDNTDTDENIKNNESLYNNVPSVFFNETKDGHYLARSIFVDTDPGGIDELKGTLPKKLYSPKQLITGIEDASGCYGRGYYSVSKPIITQTVDGIRHLAEESDCLQGFLLLHSQGGGTGSGFTSLLLDNLCIEYPKALKFQYSIYPSGSAYTSVVEPYNAILSAHDFLQTVDLSFLFQNEALTNLCVNLLKISQPNFKNLNGLVANAIANMTSTLRCESSINIEMRDFLYNLVPSPRIHFPVISSMPLLPVNHTYKYHSIESMTKDCFSVQKQLIVCHSGLGKFMACCLHYLGDVTPHDVEKSIKLIKGMKAVNFVSWSPASFKVGMSKKSLNPVADSSIGNFSKTLSAISNTTAVLDIFSPMLRKFNCLFNKRAYIHWYEIEGMEKMQFREARENINALLNDYKEIAFTPDSDQE